MSKHPPASLDGLPPEIKKAIAKQLLPVEINPADYPEGEAEDAQRQVHLDSIESLFAMIFLNKSFNRITIEYLYQANQMAAIETQRRHEATAERPCPPGRHDGPCVTPEGNLDSEDPNIIQMQPYSVRSALDWICHLPLEEQHELDLISPQRVIDHVWAMAKKYCGLRHVHIALGQRRLTLACEMLKLDSVQHQLLDLNENMYTAASHHPLRGTITTPIHPIFSVVKIPAPEFAPFGYMEFIRRLLPDGSPYIGHCRAHFFDSNIACTAARNGQLEMIKLFFDHAAHHSPSGDAIPDNVAVSCLWLSLREAPWLNRRRAIEDEISKRCRGRAWLASPLSAHWMKNEESPHSEQLGWRDIFDVPVSEWKFRGTWTGRGEPAERWLAIAVERWDTARIAQMLDRFRNALFIDSNSAPQSLDDVLIQASECEDHTRANEIVELLVNHNSMVETSLITYQGFKEAKNAATAVENYDVVHVLDQLYVDSSAGSELELLSETD